MQGKEKVHAETVHQTSSEAIAGCILQDLAKAKERKKLFQDTEWYDLEQEISLMFGHKDDTPNSMPAMDEETFVDKSQQKDCNKRKPILEKQSLSRKKMMFSLWSLGKKIY